MWCISPVSVILRCKLVSGWGLRKRRSAPLYGPYSWGRTLLCVLPYRYVFCGTVLTGDWRSIVMLWRSCRLTVKCSGCLRPSSSQLVPSISSTFRSTSRRANSNSAHGLTTDSSSTSSSTTALNRSASTDKPQWQNSRCDETPYDNTPITKSLQHDSRDDKALLRQNPTVTNCATINPTATKPPLRQNPCDKTLQNKTPYD